MHREETVKNIIFITNLHLWSIEDGKGGKAFFHTVNGYIRSGWNVVLITTGGGVPENIKSKITLIETDFEKLTKKVEEGNKLISVCARYLKSISLNRFYLQSFYNIVSGLVGSKIIYAYEVDGVSAASTLSKKYNLPLVTRFQGTVVSKMKSTLLNRIRRFPHFGALSTKADLVIMTNDGTQGLQTMKQLRNSSEKIVFWRNGVDKQMKLSPTIREEIRMKLGISDENVFITVSRLINWKRVELAINGFAEVLKRNANTFLIIVGEGPERDSLEILAKSLDVFDKIRFTGGVEQADVKRYLLASDIFLSFYDLSNLGNPIMEAMIAGKPILTINVGDTDKLIIDGVNGLLIDNDKLDMIPSYMSRLLQDVDLRSKLALGALKTANDEFWTWDERINAELDLIKSILR